MRQLDRVRVAQLMRRQPPAHSSLQAGAAQLVAHGGRVPRSAAAMAVKNAEQQPDRQLAAQLNPRIQMLPTEAVHPHLSALTALAPPNCDRTAAWVQVGLGQGERFTDSQAGPPQDDDHGSQPIGVRASTGGAHDFDDLLSGPRVGGIVPPAVTGRATGMERRSGRR